ncbi:hypothetical protein ES703_57664 [subsurface metagenome]
MLNIFEQSRIISVGSLSLPDPASKYISLKPKYSAANEYAAVNLGFFLGSNLAFPIHPAVPPGSTIKYPVEIISRLAIFTVYEASACCPTIKYGSSEFNRDINKIASASFETFVIPPGKIIIGKLTFSLIANIVSSTNLWSKTVLPPIRMASEPACSAKRAIFPALVGFCLVGSGSIKEK